LCFIIGLNLQCSCLPVRIRLSVGFEPGPLLLRTGKAFLSLSTAEPFGRPFCLGFTEDIMFGARGRLQCRSFSFSYIWRRVGGPCDAIARLKGSRIAQALTSCLGGVVLEAKITASSQLGVLSRTTAELWTAEAMKFMKIQGTEVIT
jgi:hypothetical protein